MPVDVQTIASSAVNTKWKEPYVSASINQRDVGILAPGIYRGLNLESGGGDRILNVVPDAEFGDHIAGYESSDGYFIHYRDGDSGTIALNLGGAGYASQTVVVAVFIEYVIGSTTTATFRTYTEAEFNGLPAAAQGELVVLGTVNVPAAVNPILAADITAERRTLASASQQRGTVQAAPIVRNPSFEFGVDTDTYEHSCLFWKKTNTLGTGTWANNSSITNSGSRSILLNVSSGPFSGELRQSIGTPTVTGEILSGSVAVRQIQTISSGSFQAFIEWSGDDGRLVSTTTVDLDGGAIDGSYRTVDLTTIAPAGAVSVRSVGVRATVLDPTAPGNFAYIDDFVLLVDVVNTQIYNPYDQNWRQAVNAESITVGSTDTNDDEWATGARVDFDASTPASEGTLSIKQGNPSLKPPALELLGRLLNLGGGLAGSLADGIKARIQADAASGVTEYTPMYEIDVSGQGSVRIYARDDGSFVITVNARWDGSLWNQDVAADSARFDVKTSGAELLHKTSAANWADGSWTISPISITPTLTIVSGDLTVDGTQTTVGNLDVNNSLTVIDDASVGDALTVGGSLGVEQDATLKQKVTIGANNLADRTEAFIPRIFTKRHTVAGFQYAARTLLWESGNGSELNSHNIRLYHNQDSDVNADEALEITLNGLWGDGTFDEWQNDSANKDSSILYLSRERMRIANRTAAAANWSETYGSGGWDKAALDILLGSSLGIRFQNGTGNPATYETNTLYANAIPRAWYRGNIVNGTLFSGSGYNVDAVGASIATGSLVVSLDTSVSSVSNMVQVTSDGSISSNHDFVVFNGSVTGSGGSVTVSARAVNGTTPTYDSVPLNVAGENYVINVLVFGFQA